jgi:hypothetical protein
MQTGTFVRITQLKPHTYAVEGILLTDVQLGKPVYLAGMERNDLVDGTFATALVDGVSPEAFTAGGASYRVKPLGEPGDFSLLADVLRRGLKPGEAQAF